MSSSFNEVQQIREGIRGRLPKDGSVRLLCPFCNGGSSKERSLTVYSKEGAVTYHCFRNKCKATGQLSGPVTYLSGKQNKSVSHKLEIEFLPDEHKQYLPVQDTSVPVMWEPRKQMVLYPILDFYGKELGYVQRHYKELNGWWSGPKALNIVHDTESKTPLIHFPLLTRENFCGTLTVLEDWPSAEAVAKYRPAAALIGTNLSDKDAGYLLSIGVRNLEICLDNDALAQAARLKRKLTLLFDSVSVIFIQDDPKDMDEDTLHRTFGGVYGFR